MKSLTENIYNRQLKPDQPKLKLWRHAGLMLTYRCPAKCSFCYYNCGPDKNGLMPIETALAAWQSLRNMADEDAKVHITGGEPFLYFEHLAELMKRANQLGLTPLDTIETNAFWATDEKIITERIKLLASAGMQRLKISWDPFHAEYIDIELVRRLGRTATELLGPDRIFVRWNKYLQHPVKIKHLSKPQKQAQYTQTLKDYPCRFTGRACEQLADLVADKSPQSLADDNCKTSFLASKGVHIDPYGNVFKGLCSGIIVGNVNKTPLETIWQQFNPEKHDLIATLSANGPAGLLPEAVKAGYKTKTLYADKCHLCTDIRQFFFDIGKYNSIIGPCECYRNSH